METKAARQFITQSTGEERVAQRRNSGNLLRIPFVYSAKY